MDHFSRSLFWKLVSLGFLAALFYLGYAISTRAGLPTANAQGFPDRITVYLSAAGASFPVRVSGQLVDLK